MDESVLMADLLLLLQVPESKSCNVPEVFAISQGFVWVPCHMNFGNMSPCCRRDGE